MDLSSRQKLLLKAIIELFVKTGEPVGSENIEKAYNLGVSPATIRNEMVKLTDSGFLKQPHTSAGRIPTSMGYRIYIQELMKEKEMPVSAEVSMKQDLWQKRYEENRLLREAVKTLAQRLQVLALAISEDDELFYAGAANILEWTEFEDIDVARFVLGLFDQFPTLQQIIGRAQGQDPLHILFGEDLGFEHSHPTSFVFCRYTGRGDKGGIIGIIGPARLNFPVVLPYIRYTSNIISQALRSW
jgi:heat-inducible transcriptional repressor